MQSFKGESRQFKTYPSVIIGNQWSCLRRWEDEDNCMTRDWGWTTGILDSFRRRVLSGDPVVTLCTQLSYFVPRPLTARDVSAADPFNCCGGIYILRLNRKYSSLWQMVIWKFYKPNLHVAGHWITFYTYVDNDRHLPTPETAADSEIRATFMAVAIPEVAKLL